MLPGQSEALAALVLTTQKLMAGTKVAKAAGNSRRRRRHVLVVLGRAGVVVGAAVAVAVAGETLCTGMLVIRVFNKSAPMSLPPCSGLPATSTTNGVALLSIPEM